MGELSFNFSPELTAALEKIATMAEEDVRDYEQGLCFFCGGGWPSGKYGKRLKPQHESDCAYKAIRRSAEIVTRTPLGG